MLVGRSHGHGHDEHGHGHEHGHDEEHGGHGHDEEHGNDCCSGEHGHGHGHDEHAHGCGHDAEHAHGHGHAHDVEHGHADDEHGEVDDDDEAEADVERNLAIRAAMAHVIGDILQSVGVCISAALIWGLHDRWLDENGISYDEMEHLEYEWSKKAVWWDVAPEERWSAGIKAHAW